ncbi:MAG: DoxX family protein [Prevotella sp.]|nr:DoxX family protein [Bacteroides sp.]MCM1366065.1 DoxX family protein [Prevotella sp.]MCM1436550.1 DoxX family protein [Prevotella sp.]
MSSTIDKVKNIYIKTTGYSYTNLGRLFLRLFVGLMMLQFGIRQLMYFDAAIDSFPSILGLSPTSILIIMTVIEIGCSLFLMAGFLTRLMTLPPFISMIVAEFYLLHDRLPEAAYMLSWSHQGYLPIMFMGIYFFILLVGPGKISVDYFLSLHIIHTENKSEEELEEV